MSHVIGLALGGGGARGSYQIGVLKALAEAGILKTIKHVSGTSIGAINTLMVMAGLDYDKMVEIWKRIDNHEIYGTGPDRFKKDKLGLFSLQDLYEALSQEITLSEIRESKIQGYVTAAKIKKDTLIEQVLLYRMKKKVFHLNNFEHPHRAVLASASIPVLFGSVDIDDEAYVDGGAVDNCPVDPLIENGCDIVIAVPIDGWFKDTAYKDKEMLLVNLETKKLFKFIPYDVLDFRPTIITDNAEYGYLMAMRMINKLKDMGLLDQEGTWHVPPGYILVKMTKEEEDAVRKQWKKER